MSATARTITVQAASEMHDLLSCAVPKMPNLAPDDPKTNVRLLTNLLEDAESHLSEFEGSLEELKQATFKWFKIAEKAFTPEERENAELDYEKLRVEFAIDTRMDEGKKRIRVIRAVVNSAKARKREEQAKIGTQEIPTIQAPKIRGLDLGTFSGKTSEWHEFWQVYQVTVHESSAADEIKHAMLRQALAGEARSLITGLELKDYALAVDLLTRKFGQREAYIRDLHSQLLELKPCRNINKASRFAIDVERICRLLEGQNQNISGPQTWMNLEAKLYPALLRPILEKKALIIANKNPWDTKTFREALHETIKKEELIQAIVEKREESPPSKHPGHSKPSHMPESSQAQDKGNTPERTFSYSIRTITKAQSGIQVLKRGGRKRPTLDCVFCSLKGHWPDQCRIVKSVKERIARLEESKRCNECYSQNHLAVGCSRHLTRLCYHCKGHHLASLCEKKFGSRPIPKQNNSTTNKFAESCQTNVIILRQATHQPSIGTVEQNRTSTSSPHLLQAKTATAAINTKSFRHFNASDGGNYTTGEKAIKNVRRRNGKLQKAAAESGKKCFKAKSVPFKKEAIGLEETGPKKGKGNNLIDPPLNKNQAGNWGMTNMVIKRKFSSIQHGRSHKANSGQYRSQGPKRPRKVELRKYVQKTGIKNAMPTPSNSMPAADISSPTASSADHGGHLRTEGPAQFNSTFLRAGVCDPGRIGKMPEERERKEQRSKWPKAIIR